MSVDSNGIEGNGDSGLTGAAFSSDGRYVAFDSSATNLVSGDANSRVDIFVHDRLTGATARVSVASSGAEGNGDCGRPSLSSDGRFVAFDSSADNLVAKDTNSHADVFVHDRDPDADGVFDEGNGVTTRVSVDSSGAQANYGGDTPSISGDGALVVFASIATNLVSGDGNGSSDIFLRDRTNRTTVRVSLDSAGLEGNYPSYVPRISADGAFVVFESYADNLVARDTNNLSDTFVRDRAAQKTTRVSVSSGGTQANFGTYGAPSISSDGAVISFQSSATNLDANDTNGLGDVFLHDRTTATTRRVSVDAAGADPDGSSYRAALSTGGSFVAFHSAATDLVAGDANADLDVFVHEVAAVATIPASFNCGGVAGNHASVLASLSGDGTLVAFSSKASDLVAADSNFVSDVFVHDRTVVEPDASWNSYGVGFPGTHGTPTLTPSAEPKFGTTITIDADNSLGSFTVGFMLVGSDDASIPTKDGGTLLVDFLLILPLPIWPAGLSLAVDIPSDPALCGQSAFVQIVEMDPGAQYGLSFTPGLELAFGK